MQWFSGYTRVIDVISNSWMVRKLNVYDNKLINCETLAHILIIIKRVNHLPRVGLHIKWCYICWRFCQTQTQTVSSVWCPKQGRGVGWFIPQNRMLKISYSKLGNRFRGVVLYSKMKIVTFFNENMEYPEFWESLFIALYPNMLEIVVSDL